MRRSTAFKLRLIFFGLGEALLLAALWMGVTRQMAGMNQAVNDISELKDPSPFRAALMGYLGKIHLGFQGYLRSSDNSLMDQVTQSRKDFQGSLPEFQKQNPKLFPKIAVEEIHRGFKVFDESIDHTLGAQVRRMQCRNRLDQNFARIIFLIVHNIRPIIRDEQADGEVRKETLLNIENQARTWQQNLAKAWAQLTPSATEVTFENDSRGETFLDRYARMELLPRERKVLKEIRTLWQANGDLARESFALERVVNESETFMDAQRGQVVQALNRYLPAMHPTELQARKQRYVRAIRLHGVVSVLCGLLALFSLASILIAAYRVKRGVPVWIPRLPRILEPTLQMDLKGTISTWSAAAEALYGYTASEMRGKPISKLFESEEEITRLYKDLLNAPQTTFETIHKVKSGLAIPVRIEFRPVTDTAGKATAIGLVCKHR